MTTTSSAVGTGTPPAGAPALGPAGNGPGAGRHTGKRVRRIPRRPGRMSLSNWPVSARLVAVFIVASLTGLVFGGLRVADAVSAADGYTRTAQLADLGKQVTLLAHDLENERDHTVGAASFSSLQVHAGEAHAGPAVVAALNSASNAEQAQLASAQRATSAAAAPVQQLAQAVLSNSAFPASTRNAANSVIAQLGNINAMRVQVLPFTPQEIVTAYSGTLSGLFAFNDQISSASGDPQLANDVNALGALSRAKDQAAQQRAFLYSEFIMSGTNDAGGAKATATNPAVAPFNNFSGAQALDFAGGLQPLSIAQFLQLTDLQSFQAAATLAESEAYTAAVAGTKVQTAENVNDLVTGHNGDPQAIFPQVTALVPGFTISTAASRWYTDQTAVVNSMRSVESQLATQIVARSQTLQHQAFESALITSIATVVFILLVLGATVLVGRTLVNPLRRLQADALEIATVRLPARVAAAASGGTETVEGTVVVEPIGVQSTDEIGRVARAFDQVHAEAVRLAGTEAQLRGSLNAMFISLSRRSVPLIDRLARMIDGMEQNEDDPDRLAKLFSMDHLVTRMRRNSENLLVLAGEEPVRKWTESVPLTDIARAAASEIEQYSRVALAVQPGIMISGQAAADVVHLLAELIENATLFSPQNTQVRVTVMELSSGGVLVEVRDDGVGVSPNRLSDMNWRLDHPPVVDVSISRHMGLYAVSRLAARHGIRVKLRPGAPQGLSALVWLPGTLAKREAGATIGGPPRPFTVDATGPAAGIRQTVGARPVTGRHRGGLTVGGGEPALAGAASGHASQSGQAGQATRTSAWFAAKKPSSSGTAVAEEELATNWQTTTGWQAAAARQSAASQSVASQSAASQSVVGRSATAGWEAPPAFGAPPRNAGLEEPGGQTNTGLPRRVPRTSAFPGSDTPGSGLPGMVPAGPVPAGAGADLGAPVLGAPPGGTGPQGLPRREPRSADAWPPETRSPEAPHQGQGPSRRRSPDAARSRLSGFQLGSRDAVQTGQTTGWKPFGGEENSR
jgi:signal transduction histidine kinase